MREKTLDHATDKQLWQALNQLDASDASSAADASDVPDICDDLDFMALAAQLDSLDAPQEFDDELEGGVDVSTDTAFALAHADISAARLDSDAMGMDDPALVALKNRATGLVRPAAKATQRLGLRGWAASLTAAISLSIAGFSTVQALAPFDASDLTQTYEYNLSESDLYGTDSLWSFVTIE